jgi:hypothetical protein
MTDFRTQLITNIQSSIDEVTQITCMPHSGFVLVAKNGMLGVGIDNFQSAHELRLVSITKARTFPTEQEAAQVCRHWNKVLTEEQLKAGCNVAVTDLNDAMADHLHTLEAMLVQANSFKAD